MDHNPPIKLYPFLGADDEDNYRQFPDRLEDDRHVYFHGTAESNLKSIIDVGFQPTGTLASVSFAKASSLALRYACERRAGANGCIIAVRFNCLTRTGLRVGPAVLHLDDLNLQPMIFGYCIVPADYDFV